MSVKFELRILEKKSDCSCGNCTIEVLQYRTKTRWYDGSTTKNGCRDWSEWKDVPKVFEE